MIEVNHDHRLAFARAFFHPRRGDTSTLEPGGGGLLSATAGLPEVPAGIFGHHAPGPVSTLDLGPSCRGLLRSTPHAGCLTLMRTNSPRERIQGFAGDADKREGQSFPPPVYPAFPERLTLLHRRYGLESPLLENTSVNLSRSASAPRVVPA